MDPRKQLSKIEFTGVLAATIIIFIIGIFLGGYSSDVKLSKVTNLQDDLRIDTMALELQFLIESEDLCSARPESLIEELNDVGAKLDYLENQLGVDDPAIQRLKEYYSLLEIRHWLLNKKKAENCVENGTIILYFYSNDIETCPRCKEQGFVLDYLRKKYDSLSVYSFDIASENKAVKTLVTRFKVADAPSVVVDGKTYSEFKDRSELEPLIIKNSMQSKLT